MKKEARLPYRELLKSPRAGEEQIRQKAPLSDLWIQKKIARLPVTTRFPKSPRRLLTPLFLKHLYFYKYFFDPKAKGKPVAGLEGLVTF